MSVAMDVSVDEYLTCDLANIVRMWQYVDDRGWASRIIIITGDS